MKRNLKLELVGQGLLFDDWTGWCFGFLPLVYYRPHGHHKQPQHTMGLAYASFSDPFSILQQNQEDVLDSIWCSASTDAYCVPFLTSNAALCCGTVDIELHFKCFRECEDLTLRMR